jgi:hypothetical protein
MSRYTTDHYIRAYPALDIGNPVPLGAHLMRCDAIDSCGAALLLGLAS